MILALLAGGVIGAYFGGKIGRGVGRAEGALIGLLPVARDPDLAAAYEASLIAHGELTPADHGSFQAVLHLARQYEGNLPGGPIPAAAAGALWAHHGHRPVYPGDGYFGPQYPDMTGALWTHHGYRPVYGGYFGPGR